MTCISYKDQTYIVQSGESVLDLLLRHNHRIPNACRRGQCQSCLMQAISGQPPVASQKGLKETRQAQGFFLACCCFPEQDLTIGDAGIHTSAIVVEKEQLNHRIIGLTLETESSLDYKAGQFAHLIRSDGISRPYSLATPPENNGKLEMHILRMPNGLISQWVHDDLHEGDRVEIRGPYGDCFYIPGQEKQPLLLAGTGTGLAPLYGIARDALNKGHSGPIHLFHGALYHEDLYFIDQLKSLANEFSNFIYTPCVLNENHRNDISVGDISEISMKVASNFKDWKVFLCGNPDIVNTMRKKVFLKGASIKNIYADAFLPSKS